MSPVISTQSLIRAALPALLGVCMFSGPAAAQATGVSGQKKPVASVLYRGCRDCHGASGEGSADGRAPAIAGQHYAYLLQQMMEFRDGSRVDAGESRKMHAAATASWTLKFDRAVRALAGQLSKTRALIVPVRADRQQLHISNDEVSQAAARFASQCARCHGEQAGGTASSGVPWLAGQHFPYLVSQMQQLRGGHRTTAGLPMPSTAIAGTDTELAALADYLAGLPQAK